jgi:hypothetical protein
MKALAPLLIGFCLIIDVSISHAQKEECATILPENFQLQKELNPTAFGVLKQKIARQRSQKQSGGSCINYQPILPHIIRRSDGTGGISLSDLQTELANMNATYAPACMAFYFP